MVSSNHSSPHPPMKFMSKLGKGICEICEKHFDSEQWLFTLHPTSRKER